MKENAEVYTPAWLVKDMLDLFPKDIWERLDATFLEPSCGNGNFLAQIFERKLKLCKTERDVITAAQSVYGIDILPDNVAESRKRLFDKAMATGLVKSRLSLWIVLCCNIQQGDFLTQQGKGGRLVYMDWKTQEVKTIEPDMNYVKKLEEWKKKAANKAKKRR